MRRRIRNIIQLEIEGASLSQITNPEFYIDQKAPGGFSCFLIYTPQIVDDTHIQVEIPFEDAMKLKSDAAKIQFAFTNSSGYPCATEILTVQIGDLLKETGYEY